jgi:histone H3/H4
MNTSDGVLDPLSDELRRLCVKAVENAKEDGRKTLLDRDFDFLTKR